MPLPVRPPAALPACPKCGNAQTTVTAKSQVPPMTYVRCGKCGYVTAVVTR